MTFKILHEYQMLIQNLILLWDEINEIDGIYSQFFIFYLSTHSPFGTSNFAYTFPTTDIFNVHKLRNNCRRKFCHFLCIRNFLRLYLHWMFN